MSSSGFAPDPRCGGRQQDLLTQLDQAWNRFVAPEASMRKFKRKALGDWHRSALLHATRSTPIDRAPPAACNQAPEKSRGGPATPPDSRQLLLKKLQLHAQESADAEPKNSAPGCQLSKPRLDKANTDDQVDEFRTPMLPDV